MTSSKSSSFSQKALLFAMGLGLCCGWLDVPFLNTTAEIVSALFIQLLKLVSLPIIFFAILSTVTNLSGLDELKTLGRKVLTYTLLTTLIAATIAALLFATLHLDSVQSMVDAMVTPPATTKGQYIDFALKIVPENAIVAFVEGNVIGIAFMAFLISVAVIALPEAERVPLQTLFKSLFSALLRLTQMILKLFPLGVWAFMLILFKELQNTTASSQLLWYTVAVVGANLIQGIIVLPAFLYLKGIPVRRSISGMFPALSMAFFTKSSSTTMPVTIQCAEKTLNVQPKVAQTAIPLCSVINMNGCAAFIYITVLFVSAQNGLFFSPFEMVGWIFIASLAAVGNAGVPMGCYFLTSAFLISLGVDLTWLALILPLYTFIDMIETALNVWSDSCVTLVVDKELSAS